MNGPEPLMRFVVHVDQETGKRLQSACHALRESQAAVLRRAIILEVCRLEADHGCPFPENREDRARCAVSA